MLKDNSRLATTLTPWIFVALGILGKADFSKRWELVGRLAIAWGAVALVGMPFDIVIYALEERLKRKKGEQQFIPRLARMRVTLEAEWSGRGP